MPTANTTPPRNAPWHQRIPTLLLLVALALAPRLLHAQISVYPPVLYSGMNSLTITAPAGLQQVTGYIGGRWQTLHTGLAAPYIKVTSGPIFGRCAKKTSLGIFLLLARPSRMFRLRVVDCDGNIKYFDFSESMDWDVYREQFGNITLGATACHTFTVSARGTTIIIDSVASRSPLFQIRLTGARPPLRLGSGREYKYDVCFRATKLGFVKMPILVYVRRNFPAGGHTNFIVADTAYVTVVPPRGGMPQTPRPAPQVRPKPRVLVAQPKPIIIARPKPKPPRPPVVKVVPPPDTAHRPPPIAVVTPRSVPAEIAPVQPAMPTIADAPLPTFTEQELTDPTTHRAVLMPTARSVDSGRLFVANYDGAGWMAGYGLDDRTTLLGGFAYVPEFISYNLVLTAGARRELIREDNFRVAAGAQFNFSRTDLSSILLAAPYAVASLGDDDQRLTAGISYTWRHHIPADSMPAFDKTAIAVGLGGDYRFARHWKAAAETYVIQDASVQPLVLTLRYFDHRFAIDAGVGFDLGLIGPARSGMRVAPVISGTYVW